MNNMFEEHQYQRRLLPWSLVAVVWGMSFWHLFKNGLSEDNLISDISVLIIIPVVVSLTLFLLRLSVKINSDYFMYKMFPFHWRYRQINLDQIKEASIQEYNKDRTSHGWGFRISLNGKYKSYTVKGYQGIELTLKNGNKLFFGSGKANEMLSLLNASQTMKNLQTNKTPKSEAE